LLQGGEETGAAVARAIKFAVACNAKIINMSFGEPAARSSGFLRRIIDDAVLQHGVTFLASAGNAGPALQVAPKVLSRCIIVVVSKRMQSLVGL
jgi:subtilisin family serine protease